MSEAIASVIEIVERNHAEWEPDGAVKPEILPPVLLVPNLLRINGHDIWAASDHPVEVGPIRMRHLGRHVAEVAVTFLAHLTDGIYEKPSGGPPAAELTVGDDDSVILNGQAVIVEEQGGDVGGVEVLHRHAGTNYVRVRLHLAARKVVIDYEHNPLGWPSLHAYYPAEPGFIPPAPSAAEILAALARIRAAKSAAEWDPADVALSRKLWALQDTSGHRLQSAEAALRKARRRAVESAAQSAHEVEFAEQDLTRAQGLATSAAE